jgi:hypothetical protein
MSNRALTERLIVARMRVDAIAPELSRLAFDNPPEAVGAWLAEASGAAKTKNYVLAQPSDPAVETVYIEINDFPYNTDLWMLSAFAFGPRASDEYISVSEWFDSLVGEELGDLRVGEFPLTGMEPAQRWFETSPDRDDAEVARPVEELVRLSAFDLLDRGLEHAAGFDARLAVRRHEEPLICVWEPSELATLHPSLYEEDAE